MELLQQKIQSIQERFRSINLAEHFRSFKEFFLSVFYYAKNIGIEKGMDDYERRKLSVFNQLNFFQLLTGLFIPFLGLMHKDHVPFSALLLLLVPGCVSVITLLLNYFRRYEAGQLAYFILYPLFTSFVYIKGMNAGIELHFILYGVLAVFFLQDMGYMLFTLALSMVSYFILSLVLKHFQFELRTEDEFLYIFNHLLALGFIFYGLFLIKKENTEYQFAILAKQRVLHQKKLEIEKQKEQTAEKAKMLEAQKAELSELNSLKNKLFSVISHDLKSPMYALRNLFKNIYEQNLSEVEVKSFIPEVLMDLNYTIGLMENLLQWSKSQMQSSVAKHEELDVSQMIIDVMHVLRLQAEAKQIYIESKNNKPVYVYADKDMVNLVLRNLLSNAIKFTPQHGNISVGVNELNAFVEVYVQDSGMGIDEEAMKKINENNFYTTHGTASESGTGLGLMLCKEFLAKNKGQMHVESEPGKGSVFSFTLPKS